MHGGRVEARSDGAGQGSTFVVRLPALPEAAETPAGRPVAAATLGGSQTRRILIADDNPDAAESLALLLRLAGHEVEIARDGLEAVAAADRCRPDVILLDLGMPRLDGCGACRQIRTWPWARQVPIVALTGWGQDQDRQRSCEAGFDRHLVKPVDPAELLRLLDEPSRPERAACAFEGPSGVDGAARRC
jgi:CheY-like chemotaxis protein